MNRKDYRTVFDDVAYSDDFQQRAIEQMRQAVRQPEEKERRPMKRHSVRTLVLAAAIIATLVISVSAAVILLSPKQVAAKYNDPILAAAFQGDEAVTVNQSIESEGYRFTLAGFVSGKGLSTYLSDVEDERTYVVLSAALLDGSPIEEATATLSLSPLVAGYPTQQVNAWTLGGGYLSFVENGVAYYLFDCQSITPFADCTVYLAAYEGFAPGPDIFAMAEDGSISFQDSVTGPRALFTLPLDPADADPDAAAQFLEDCGILP